MRLDVALRHRLGGFSLDVAFDAPGGATVLLGRSGSGKTTIINAVAGLVRPDVARVALGAEILADSATGVWLPPHRRRVGYVFQDARLFPHLNVRQNLLYGDWFARRAGLAGAGAGFDQVVDLLGVEALLERRPGALSGGEKQRIAIGRALLARPRLLLADEPLASLDAPRKAEILPYFERLRDELALPILYVTHSAPEAARLASTVVALRAGRVLAAGPTAAVFADPSVAAELGVREAGAILSGRLVERGADGLVAIEIPGGRVTLPDPGLEIGAPIRLRIAAQDVILALDRPERISALNVLEATVAALRPGQGPGMLVALTVGPSEGGERLLARITRRSGDALGLSVGARVFAIVKSVSVARADIGMAARPATDLGDAAIE